MQELTNLLYSAVYKLLHGYQSRGTTQSGLLEKCPAISFTDRTVTSDDDVGRSVRRRAHAYQLTSVPTVTGLRVVRSGWVLATTMTTMMKRGILQMEARFRKLQQTSLKVKPGLKPGINSLIKKYLLIIVLRAEIQRTKNRKDQVKGLLLCVSVKVNLLPTKLTMGLFILRFQKYLPQLPLPLAAHSAKMQKLQQTALFCSTYRAVITRCLTFPSPGPYAPCAAIRVRNMLKSRRLNGRRGQIVRLSGSVRSVIKRHGSGNRVKVLLSRVFLRSTGWRIFQTILAVVRFATSKKRCTSTGRRERVSVSTVTTVRTG